MKLELCSYSGYKIHPGRGKKLIRVDGKILTFITKKCERSFWMKRNPRDITWTMLYRRKHKKGLQEEAQKRKTKKSTKFQRPIASLTLAEIIAKRNQKPEVRKAQREQAIRAAKEKQRAKQAEKKQQKLTEKAQMKGQQKAMKAAKPVTAKAPRIGGKR